MLFTPVDPHRLARCSRCLTSFEQHGPLGWLRAQPHGLIPAGPRHRWEQGAFTPGRGEGCSQNVSLSRRGRTTQSVEGVSRSEGQPDKGSVLASCASLDNPKDSAISNTDKKKQLLTVPTALTLCRLVAIPLLVATFFLETGWSAAGCSFIFVGASATDWLDGYLARKLGAVTPFGKFLDPVADKLMVATALVLLSGHSITAGFFAGNDWMIPTLALVIISREITMSSLREWAATVSPEAYKAVAVGGWGKWKTASQMAAIVLLLYTSGSTGPAMGALSDVGVVLLGVAATLAVWSLGLYIRNAWRHL